MSKQKFTKEQCEALFNAILADDDIDLNAEAPTNIQLDYSQEQIEQCYRICLQLWVEGVSRTELLSLVEKTHQLGNLDESQKLKFKYIRAKFKHLRFACAIFAKKHRSPILFQILTGLMGNLQDAFKNNKKKFTTIFAWLVRLFLGKYLYRFSTKKLIVPRLSGTDCFKEFILNDIKFLCNYLAQEKVTSKQFHEMRKVISRQVSLYSNLMVLYPFAEHLRLFRYLSTINGLMGEMHDDLILRKFENVSQYYFEKIHIPTEIKQRLQKYVNCYSSFLRF